MQRSSSKLPESVAVVSSLGVAASIFNFMRLKCINLTRCAKMLLSRRLFFGVVTRSNCRPAFSSSCKLWAEEKDGNFVEDDDVLPKWKKKITVQATVLSQTLKQLKSDGENMAEKFGIPDETYSQ